MDEWTEDQLKVMQLGGNAEARKYFKQYEVHEVTSVRLYFGLLLTAMLTLINRSTQNIIQRVRSFINRF